MNSLQVVSQSVAVVAITCFLLAQSSLSQKYQPGSKVSLALVGDDHLTNSENRDSDQGGERVEKLVSASGDLFWRQAPQVPLSRYLDEPLGNQYQLVGLDLLGQAAPRFIPSPQRQFMVDERGQLTSQPVEELLAEVAAATASTNLRNHRELVDDFKHWSNLANPSRESRAFKPKLMSTARGFGKRTPAGSANHLTYADLLASAGPNGPLTTNGKMSGNAIR